MLSMHSARARLRREAHLAPKLMDMGMGMRMHSMSPRACAPTCSARLISCSSCPSIAACLGASLTDGATSARSTDSESVKVVPSEPSCRLATCRVRGEGVRGEGDSSMARLREQLAELDHEIAAAIHSRVGDS